jgi:hypothetical protein
MAAVASIAGPPTLARIAETSRVGTEGALDGLGVRERGGGAGEAVGGGGVDRGRIVVEEALGLGGALDGIAVHREAVEDLERHGRARRGLRRSVRRRVGESVEGLRRLLRCACCGGCADDAAPAPRRWTWP